MSEAYVNGVWYRMGPSIVAKTGSNTMEVSAGVTPSPDSVTVGDIPITRCACVMDYQLNPSDYIPRREPDRLNWGPWMNSAQLEQAELKANRVTIPGDWDYVGVAV